VYDSNQPYTISLRCTNQACSGFITSYASLNITAYDFFHGDTGVHIIHRIVNKRIGKESCSRCKAAFIIAHLKYGDRL